MTTTTLQHKLDVEHLYFKEVQAAALAAHLRRVQEIEEDQIRQDDQRDPLLRYLQVTDLMRQLKSHAGLVELAKERKELLIDLYVIGNHSYRSLGELVGLSSQRVWQLMNADVK